MKADKAFGAAGLTYDEGYIHAVDPLGDMERRDLVWTGILQMRHFKDPRFRRDLRPDLSDEQIADNWWAGAASEKPDWEYVAREAVVLGVDENPTRVRPSQSLLSRFDEG